MKILITGGMGFVGSHLTDQFLADDHKLILLTRSETKKQNISNIRNQITIEQVDVTNFTQLGKSIKQHKPEVIIHLAGETSHSKSFENPLYDIDSNTKSTLFILDNIRKMDLKCKFILGSTFIVVGRPSRLPVTEETPCNPTTIYGANRLASEHYCKIYHQVYGMDTLIFRITNSFGPREQITANKNAINFLIHNASQSKNITIFNKGKFFRDIIFISDVVTGINTVMKKGKPGNLYWISSGKKTWFYELGNWLESLTNAKVKYVKTPQYTKKVDVGNFIVNNAKLKSLGWKPTTSVKDGIKKTLQYFEMLR